MNNISLHSILNEMVSNITEADYLAGLSAREALRGAEAERQAAYADEAAAKVAALQKLKGDSDVERAEARAARTEQLTNDIEAQRLRNVEDNMSNSEKLGRYADVGLQHVKNTAQDVGDWYTSKVNNINNAIDIAQVDAANAANDGSATLGQILLHKTGGLVDWAQENPGLALGGATAAALVGGAGALALRKKLAAQKRG